MSKKTNDPDLVGFKEFIEDQKIKLNTKPPSGTRAESSSHELLTFLNHETTRLDKLISLVEEKTHILKNYPQDSAIKIELETQLIKNRVFLFENLKSRESIFWKNLNEVYLKHFNF